MRTIIDLGNSQTGPFHVITAPTSVDCAREVRFRRSFRHLVECMVPACCSFPNSPEDSLSSDTDSVHSSGSGGGSSTVTCTFFGHRNGRVSFCIQNHTRGPPLLLLEFAVATSYLAREMEHGLLRIALECDRRRRNLCSSDSLYDVPVWYMYCNGRKAGFAVRRRLKAGDAAVLKRMESMSVGAGVLPENGAGAGELMYLRASFDRVIGSADSESFHMINPVGSSGQELSIFLLRS
ncbi:protein MIZU-KUSSEI 1 [Andrographis paniculata]|uniref:protein MIZU-KUSSEI 1 n=1 Tax=Andrographis paniculata TaxID=175694 RepID=UPI0021E7DE8B|nr:protein MIZU-KUSSEI 1 [Andrographis paniculata]